MRIAELGNEIINDLRKTGVDVSIQYIHNQSYEPTPFIIYNYLTYEDYHANDKLLFSVAEVTLNVIIETVEYDKIKILSKQIKNANFKKACKWYDNESRCYIMAFTKKYIVWE